MMAALEGVGEGLFLRGGQWEASGASNWQLCKGKRGFQPVDRACVKACRQNPTGGLATERERKRDHEADEVWQGLQTLRKAPALLRGWQTVGPRAEQSSQQSLLPESCHPASRWTPYPQLDQAGGSRTG